MMDDYRHFALRLIDGSAETHRSKAIRRLRGLSLTATRAERDEIERVVDEVNEELAALKERRQRRLGHAMEGRDPNDPETLAAAALQIGGPSARFFELEAKRSHFTFLLTAYNDAIAKEVGAAYLTDIPPVFPTQETRQKAEDLAAIYDEHRESIHRVAHLCEYLETGGYESGESVVRQIQRCLNKAEIRWQKAEVHSLADAVKRAL